MTDGVYGLSYSGVPGAGLGLSADSSGLGLQAPSFQDTGVGSFAPDYSLAGGAPTGAASPTTAGGGMSTGQMVGAGMLGLGALGFMRGGGGGGGVNLDPTGFGAQMTGEAQQLWGMYQKGEITPSDQSRIANWEQQQTKATQDYYERAGLGDSSMAKEAVGQVGAHAQQMRQQANQNLLGPAMQASGLADQYSQRLVQYQIQQDQAKQQAQQQFMGTIATIAAIALM